MKTLLGDIVEGMLHILHGGQCIAALGRIRLHDFDDSFVRNHRSLLRVFEGRVLGVRRTLRHQPPATSGVTAT